MKRYSIRHGLHAAETNGRFVFLDVDADRYFCLPDKLEKLFQCAAAGQAQTSGEVQPLLQRCILVASEAGAQSRGRPQPLRSSLLEDPDARIPALPSGAALLGLLRACAEEHLLSFKSRIDRARLTKAAMSNRAPSTSAGADALRFLAARRLVRSRDKCLRESMALFAFLVRRGHHAELVIGVTMDPFSAHCWVQHGAVVLNDRLDHAASHTPILAI
jgi:hypothetical protein